MIVWKESAIADFVRENQVGIAVDSLDDLPTVLKDMTDEEYVRLKENTRIISDRVHSGYYFKNALQKCMQQ